MVESLAEGEWPPRGGFQRLTPVRVEEVGDGVYWAQSFANAGWVITNDGVVLIDTGGGIASSLMLAELRKLTDKPVRYIIYTHGHEDHVVGAQLFAQEGTTVIAHEMVPERLRTNEMLPAHQSHQQPPVPLRPVGGPAHLPLP